MLTAVILTILVGIFSYFLLKRSRTFPPGPTALPIIGTIYVTRDTPHLCCIKLVEKYGPVIGLKFAGSWAVVLHGAKLVREVFNDPAASGRLASEATNFLLGDEYGIVQSTGSVWLEQRRFAMRALRDFGFGRSSMEEMILNEAQELCDWLKKQEGRPVELTRRFSLAVVNSLWRILTGERYDHDDKGLIHILDTMESTQNLLLQFKSPLKVALLLFYPKVAKIFSNYTGWNKLVELAKSKDELLDRIITEHSATIQTDNPRDFVDVYLNEVSGTVNPASSFHPKTGKRALRSVMSDLFVAGSDTTSVTLNWTILYLLHNPQVLAKVQAELDSVVGTSRSPNLTDRKNLPYVEAVIMEVLRCSSIVPVGVSHCCIEDTIISGYKIPKGTVVNANVYQIHHDPDVWGDPETFRPERFLNPDGSCMQRHESFMPFSVGRRVCMGENLARDTLFLFTTTLLQNFHIRLPPGNEMPTIAPKLGQLTLQPQRFQVSMIPRH